MPISPLVLAFYLLLAWLYFAPSGSWTQQCFAGGFADTFGEMWFLNWWPFALLHHLNPFISHYVWYPRGDNLTWATSVPAIALAMMPITLTAGPVVSYNLLGLTAPALSAWMAFGLARHLTRNVPAAIFAGYIYGFSSYEFAQFYGHLDLFLVWLIPAMLWLCLARHAGGIGRRTFIAALAALLACQLGISTEVLASFVILGGLSGLIFLACAPPPDRPALWRLARECTSAGLIALILAAPFLYYMLRGLQNLPPEFNSPVVNSTDPLNYLIPTFVSWANEAGFAPIARKFTATASEQGAYLGLPLVAIMAAHFHQSWRAPYQRALALVVIMLVVFSLGPQLHILTRTSHFMLPWAIFTNIPVIRSLLPLRFTLYVTLCAGLALGLWLARPASLRLTAAKYACALLACATVLPNLTTFAWHPVPFLPFFAPANVRAALGPHPNVLILPFGANGADSAWQFQSGMAFTQSGGYLGYTPMYEAVVPEVVYLFNTISGKPFETQLPGFCQSHHIDDILIAPGTPPAMAASVAAMHWPTRANDGVLIVTVPKP